MYLVVEFFPKKDLAIIPSNWIIQQGPDREETEAIFQVYWPPVREPSKLNKLVKECASPTNFWKKYSARKLGSSGKCYMGYQGGGGVHYKCHCIFLYLFE